MGAPKISVVMPCYNIINYVEEAVSSILNQTFTDFELIVIDDCSTDGTREYLQNIQDERVKVVLNKKNQGFARTTNIGASKVTTKYLASMDGDDISFPERLEKQFNFMEKNPKVDVVFAYAQRFQDDGSILKPWKADRESVTNEQIRKCLYKRNCLVNPTAFMRTASFANDAKDESITANGSDYEYWLRCSMKGLNFAKIQEELLSYRVRDSSMTAVRLSKDQVKKLEYRIFLKKTAIKNTRKISTLFKNPKLALAILELRMRIMKRKLR